MFELNAVHALLVLAAWFAACYLAITRFSAIQRLLAFSLHRGLLRCGGLGQDGKPCRVIPTSSGVTISTMTLRVCPEVIAV